MGVSLDDDFNYFKSIKQRNSLSVVYHLLFNVTSFPTEEHLQEAELKLWVIVDHPSDNRLGAYNNIFVKNNS